MIKSASLGYKSRLYARAHTQFIVLRRLIFNPQIVTLALRLGQVFFAACVIPDERNSAASAKKRARNTVSHR